MLSAGYQHPWKELSEDILKCSLLKCDISNALDGSQDNAIRADMPVNKTWIKMIVPEEDDVDELDPFSDDEDME